MKMVFTGNYTRQIIFAIVVAIVLGFYTFNVSSNIMLVFFLNFMYYFILSNIFLSVTKKQLMFLIPLSLILAFLFIVIAKIDDAYFLVLIYHWEIYFALLAIPFIIYDFYKHREINFIIALSIILFLISYFFI